MDAVRVMTVHGSKGLEFSAVHLPTIATGYMPGSWRGVRIKPPPLLARLAMQSDGHEAEEECIFFVALSRARDTLSLTRADRYTSRTATASKFLNTLARPLPTRNFSGSGETYLKELRLDPPSPKDTYPERDLELYMKCPARYRYEVIDGLRGGRDESAYISFHRCVYQTVGWLEEEQQKGNPIDVAGALAALARIWERDGPKGHPFEKYHRAAAEQMVKCLAGAIVAETATYDRVQNGSVSVGERSISITARPRFDQCRRLDSYPANSHRPQNQVGTWQANLWVVAARRPSALPGAPDQRRDVLSGDRRQCCRPAEG